MAQPPKGEDEETALTQPERDHIAKRLLAIRKGMGLRQTPFAKKIGIHQTTVSKVENATPSIGRETAAKIAHALGLDPVDFIGTEAPVAQVEFTEESWNDPLSLAIRLVHVLRQGTQKRGRRRVAKGR